MNISFLHSHGAEAPIKIPAIGLDLFVRMPPSASGGEFCFIETINAPGAGPPRHRHKEAEIFHASEETRSVTKATQSQPPSHAGLRPA